MKPSSVVVSYSMVSLCLDDLLPILSVLSSRCEWLGLHCTDCLVRCLVLALLLYISFLKRVSEKEAISVVGAVADCSVFLKGGV